MTFEEAIESLDSDGFSWARIREYFPFGSINLREGNFQKLILKALEKIEDKEKKELLLDIFDTQNCVFLEQIWIQNEQFEVEEDKPFPVYGHFISAQLQITSNIRSEQGLKRRDPRATKLKVPESEMLLDRILGTNK